MAFDSRPDPQGDRAKLRARRQTDYFPAIMEYAERKATQKLQIGMAEKKIDYAQSLNLERERQKVRFEFEKKSTDYEMAKKLALQEQQRERFRETTGSTYQNLYGLDWTPETPQEITAAGNLYKAQQQKQGFDQLQKHYEQETKGFTQQAQFLESGMTEALGNNQNKRWVDALFNPGKQGHSARATELQKARQEGRPAETHKLAYAESDGEYVVYPTIREENGELIEMGSQEAANYFLDKRWGKGEDQAIHFDAEWKAKAFTNLYKDLPQVQLPGRGKLGELKKETNRNASEAARQQGIVQTASSSEQAMEMLKQDSQVRRDQREQQFERQQWLVETQMEQRKMQAKTEDQLRQSYEGLLEEFNRNPVNAPDFMKQRHGNEVLDKPISFNEYKKRMDYTSQFGMTENELNKDLPDLARRARQRNLRKASWINVINAKKFFRRYMRDDAEPVPDEMIERYLQEEYGQTMLDESGRPIPPEEMRNYEEWEEMDHRARAGSGGQDSQDQQGQQGQQKQQKGIDPFRHDSQMPGF